MTTTPSTFTLELLHIADQEAGAAAVTDAANLSGVLNALRDEDLGNDGMADNTLTLSSGDAFIPGVFYDASEAVFGAGGIADIQIQNELGIQAISLGNHEFDFGTREISELITGLDVTDDSDPDDGFVDTIPRVIGNFDALSGTDLDGQDFTGTDFAYLSTNLDFSTDPFLAPLETAGGQDAASQSSVVSSSVVADVNGEPIGIVGATTPALASISSPGSVGISPTWASGTPTDAELDALAAEIQTEVDALLAANTSMNKVVLLSHMQQLSIELGLAERLENVDIIVGGGSNTRLFDDNDRPRDGDSDQGQYPQFITNAGGTQTAVVNTDGSYKYVGRLVIDFDANGDIITDSYDETVSGAYATDDQGVADLNAESLIDPEIQAIADAIEAQIIATESNVFGVSDVFLNANRSGTFADDDPDGVRTQETNLGNLTADANLAAAATADPEVVISLKNGGGIRASIGETVVPAGGTDAVRTPNGELVDGDGEIIKVEGGISQTDIQTTLAFNNGLTLLTLTGAELLAVLEHGVGALPGVSGAFPQVSGVRFSFDETQPSGSRIESVALTDENDIIVQQLVRDGELLDGVGDQLFRIVTLDFLAAPRFDDDGNFIGGGDGYPFPNTNTDPTRGEVGDPAVVARVNAVALEQEGVQTGGATFADDGTEQDALAEYLDDNFNPLNGGKAFGSADTGIDTDARIQNLSARTDSVLSDTVVGTSASETLILGAGDDFISGGAGFDLIDGGAGDDTIDGGAQPDRISGGDGDDNIMGDTGGDQLSGDRGNDTIDGGDGDDSIDGNAGFDMLFGGNGDDFIEGGDQADNLMGGDGFDFLLGEDGADRLFGDAGVDTLDGGNGNDALFGGADGDTLIGGSGNDSMWGEDGDDTISGNSGFDTLRGRAGDDTLNGGDQADTLLGDRGDDTMFGDDGADRLFGGSGFDIINGGTGNDTLRGDFNADRFVFVDGFGQDRILDFEDLSNSERIDLSGVTAITDFADLQANHLGIVDGVARITADVDNYIELASITTTANLDQNDFIF